MPKSQNPLQVASDFADLLETTGDDAGDFEIDPDQSNIQTAANNAESVILVSSQLPTADQHVGKTNDVSLLTSPGRIRLCHTLGAKTRQRDRVDENRRGGS